MKTPSLRSTARFWRGAPFILSLLLTLAALLVPAHVEAFGRQPLGLAGKMIDWAHPIPVHLPGPGQPRSGVGAVTNAAANTTPEANFPGGCYRGSPTT